MSQLACVAGDDENARLAQGVKLQNEGDLQGALREYTEFLKTHPERIEAHSNLGAVYARLGRYREAIQQYTEALGLDEQNPAVHYNLGLAYYNSGRTANAAAQFERVMALQPDNRKAAEVLADCRLGMGDVKGVITLLMPLAANAQDDPAMLYLLGTALIRDNQVERGQLLIDRILKNGDSASAHLLLGRAAMMARDYRNAASEFKRAISLDPRLPGAQGSLGRAIMAAGEPEQAIEAFRTELEINPNDYDSNLYLGVLLKEDRNYAKALPYLQRALEIRPGAPEVRYQVASLQVATGETGAALEALEALVKEAPDFLEAHVSLATVYFRLKRMDDGRREREIVRKLNDELQARQTKDAGGPETAPEPTVPFEVVANKASSAREADRTAEAISLYQEGLRLKPDWAEGWWYLGTLFYENDRYTDALPVFQKLADLKPKGGPAWAMLGLCEFELKNYRQAADHLQKARALGLPKSHLSTVVLYHFSVLLNRFGESEAATQFLFGLARQEGDSPAAVQALGLAALAIHYLPKELPPDKADVVMRAGWAEYYVAQRNVAEADRRFNELLAAYPREPGVHYAHGVFLLASDPDGALSEFRKEIEISPEHVNARLQIAFEYIKRKEYPSGLPYAEQAVKLAPTLFAGHNALGRILLETGDVGRAVEELEAGHRFSPESPETCYALSRAYSRAGRKQDAERARAEFKHLDQMRRALQEGHASEPTHSPE